MEKGRDHPDEFFAMGASAEPPPRPHQHHLQVPPTPFDNRRRALSFATTTTNSTPPLPQQHYLTRSRFSVAPAGESQRGGVVHNNNNNIPAGPQPWFHHHPQAGDDKPLSSHVLAGLSTAGVASTLLTTLFVHIVTMKTTTHSPSRPAVRRFWSVETDLDHHNHREENALTDYYTFPSYDSATRVALLTLASLTGAWWLDQQQQQAHMTPNYYRRRSDWIGVAGMILTVSWVLSLWGPQNPWLYEACLGVFTIVLASAATDDHLMTYNARTWFQFSSEIVYLLATLVVTFVWIFFLNSTTRQEQESDKDGHDDKGIMMFSILIVLLALFIFVVAQNMILGRPLLSVQSLLPRRRKVVPSSSSDSEDWRADAKPQRRRQWRSVLQTIWQSRNFRAWIGMEMLLEAQVLFQTAFGPVFMERLIDRDEQGSTQWLEPATKPLRQLAGILVYLPIQRYGYVQIYTVLFYANLIVSLMLLILGDYTKLTGPVLFALPIVSGAVLNSGFQFAMADMTLEIKHSQASRGKLEPSIAALLLGFNAVFCKPMKHIFVAMGKLVLHESNNTRVVAFYLMVIVPMICSVLQLYFWSGYGLTRQRVTTMRADFQRAVLVGVERHDSGQVSV